MAMQMTRAESSRVYKEFEEFYDKHPRLRLQANHQIFLDAAEQDGGSEVLTAEWMELQMDSLKLAMLSETPEEALNKFIRENPAYDCEANRQIILQRIRETRETIPQAVAALRNQLAFDEDIANEQIAENEKKERTALIDEIALDYSPFQHAQDIQRQKLQHLPIEQLRADVQVIRDRKRFRQMTKEQLKEHIRQQRGEQPTPALPELPKYIQRADLVALLLSADGSGSNLPVELVDGKTFKSGKEAFKYLCEKYSYDEVNKRLGTFTAPRQIAGHVRQVRLEI
jgi:type IV secretory pathway VirJ component